MQIAFKEMSMASNHICFPVPFINPEETSLWTCIEDRNGPFRPSNILMQFSQWKT